ncbi:MAG: tetratricopeptide repeat protein [Thermoanaerobaculaceae bacterium]|nr:tetratricopeptide repeat protein [Thermoanaerobaculaceae bacterium]
MIKRILFLTFLTLFTSYFFCQEKVLYDQNLYEKAIEKLRNSEIDQSLPLFQEMIDTSSKEVWTCQALLVCDRNDLLEKSDTLAKLSSQNVIVIKRMVDTKECFRLCAGLFTNKNSAVELAKSLPSPFKEAKPYPLLIAKNGKLSEIAFTNLSEDSSKKTVARETKFEKNEIISPDVAEEKKEKTTDLGEELFLKGLTAYSSNDLKSAENYFRQSITLRPNRFEAYNNLGAVLLEQKRYEEARTVLEQGVKIQPYYANSRANLAGAYWFLGLKDEAVKEAERAFKLDAGNVKYSLNLASFLFELQRYNDAKTYINVAKIISPENPDVLSLEAKINEKLGIIEEKKEEKISTKEEEKKEKPQIKEKESPPPSQEQTEPKEEGEKKGLLRRIFKKRSTEKTKEEKD